MLKSLSISNYALIDQLLMQPASGLSMITGETGAGKSIMLGAMGMLLGNRADTKVLLHEDKKCVVEAVFEIGSYKLQEFFELHDLDFDSTCIIRREISPSGKSRTFINDTPVLLETLKTLGERLVDVHSQHDTLQLASGAFQLGLIDAFSQSKNELETYRVAFKAFKSTKKRRTELAHRATELKKEADFNAFQLEELSVLALQAGEQSELESSQEILENAEEIKLRINEILQLLQDDQLGVTNAVTQINQGMQQLSKLAHVFDPLRDRFHSLMLELRDIEESLSDEENKVEVDFEKLDQTRDRLSRIYLLQKKHGLSSVEELISLERELADKVFEVQNLDEILEKADQELTEAENLLQSTGLFLRKKRLNSTAAFAKELSQLLAGLGMENAKIEIEHHETIAGISGLDEIEILFSANKGAAPQALKKVASGGEFSRLLFAIKYLMADKMELPTLIFDEIDTGISGEVALKMVGMMQDISKRHQVICITHLPQVAGKGDVHYFVYKDNTSEKTISKIKLLSLEERIEELAKMISGVSPSASALESARELVRK
ncbi:MAG: DNA repair protein RecN (Recombination protein N) [Algoriphagus sp.]|jgi:DNA repair protein RecN (Recombination protein N)